MATCLFEAREAPSNLMILLVFCETHRTLLSDARFFRDNDVRPLRRPVNGFSVDASLGRS
jgi:hypothetical protein